MRRLLVAALAALALAGCSLDLEGAACELPGATSQCPTGQRCGIDLRCSSQAVTTCPDRAGTEIVVDAAGGSPAGWPAPTGVRAPAGCRFPTLEQGLAAAKDVPGAVVVVAGAAVTYPVTVTLAVPAGVTLRSDDVPPSPGTTRVLSLDGAGLAAGVTLAEGAVLSGFTVRNGAAPAAAVGVDVACGAGTAVARLQDVVVEAAGSPAALASGVRAGGSCPVELARVTVRGAAGPGLLVARDAPSGGAPLPTLVATDSTFDGNGEGVRVSSGEVTLQRALVKGSAAAGVTAAKGASLTVDQSVVRGNGDTGVVVMGNGPRARLTGNRICGNATGAAAVPRGFLDLTRKVGGVYLLGNPPADVAFLGNAVHDNGGDQVMVAGSGPPPIPAWPLDGAPADATACGAGRNVFAGYLGTSGRGLFAAYARATARWNGWEGVSPTSGTDYDAGSPTAPGTASVDVGSTEVCAPPSASERSCD